VNWWTRSDNNQRGTGIREEFMTIQQVIAEDVRGHAPLWVVFWIYGVVISQLLFGGILYLYRQMDTPMLAASLIGFLFYTVWIMRSVWVNAFNAEKEVYGHIARALTVAWSFNSVLVSAFLFLGHFGTVALPI
jgi:hypothetical protein